MSWRVGSGIPGRYSIPILWPGPNTRAEHLDPTRILGSRILTRIGSWRAGYPTRRGQSIFNVSLNTRTMHLHSVDWSKDCTILQFTLLTTNIRLTSMRWVLNFEVSSQSRSLDVRHSTSEIWVISVCTIWSAVREVDPRIAKSTVAWVGTSTYCSMYFHYLDHSVYSPSQYLIWQWHLGWALKRSELY